MIALEEAQARIFALKDPVETERAPLSEAAGRWAAEDVLALRTQPARNLSAMDGYAVRFADGGGPWRVIGESAAGRRFTGSTSQGDAVRIFTGAVMPDGCDTVIIQENVTRDRDIALLTGNAPKNAGHNVRHAGGDFQKGAIVVARGAELHARHVALAAMAGHGELLVRRRLKIALFSTGDELVVPGMPCADDQIPSSNGVMLAALLKDLPVDITEFSAVPDDLAVLTRHFAELGGHDIIVTTGGASVGDHDLIVPALKAAGGNIEFWKIAMRPGKPVIAGRLNDAILLGLPGNPVSAFVTAFLLLKPLVAHLGGSRSPLPSPIKVTLGESLGANGERLDHLRGQLRDGKAYVGGVNDSSMLAALANSNILIKRDINADALNAGATVECYWIG